MLPASTPPASGVASVWLNTSSELPPASKAREFARHLIQRGVDPELAQDAAIVLAYKPVPWSPTDQAIVKRAWFQCWDGIQPLYPDDSGH
ncbi:hypothetical protein [Pseudanabaena sp. FACHB-2040]|uniref:hypothetical protein n=1 Tax=Pseudanabaena sp. FACHB-2040 TaxID=2692859 RepID=UPI001689081E|nr:hypothetical protein [Pseudanabaena sp. FACHB-2040]MBD2259901.1 hypothetical protein [Pseudanabaena sp. FACHB-2040]